MCCVTKLVTDVSREQEIKNKINYLPACSVQVRFGSEPRSDVRFGSLDTLTWPPKNGSGPV